jgi:hypothetical protein
MAMAMAIIHNKGVSTGMVWYFVGGVLHNVVVGVFTCIVCVLLYNYKFSLLSFSPTATFAAMWLSLSLSLFLLHNGRVKPSVGFDKATDAHDQILEQHEITEDEGDAGCEWRSHEEEEEIAKQCGYLMLQSESIIAVV